MPLVMVNHVFGFHQPRCGALVVPGIQIPVKRGKLRLKFRPAACGRAGKHFEVAPTSIVSL